MSNNRAWMPLHIDTYLADTGYLTAAEHGAYMLLIMTYWRDGGLPDDERMIARIARMSKDEWAESRDVLASFFKDGWRHSRIDEELAKADEIIEKRRNAALGRHTKNKSDASAEQVHSKCSDTGALPRTYNQDPKEEPKGSSKSPRAWLETVVDPKRAKDVVEMRQRIRKPLTARGAELLAGQLSKWHDPNEAADAMVLNAWQGFKPEYLQNRQARGSPPSKPSKPDPFKAYAQELADEQERNSRSDFSNWDDAQSVPQLTIEYQRR